MSMITDQAALQALQVIITKAKELAPIPIPSTLELQQDIGHEESADLQENTAEEDNENRVEQRQVQRRRRRVRNKISKVGSRQSTENIFSYIFLRRSSAYRARRSFSIFKTIEMRSHSLPLSLSLVLFSSFSFFHIFFHDSISADLAYNNLLLFLNELTSLLGLESKPRCLFF